MRQLLLIFTLLLTACWAVAQNDPSKTATPDPTTSPDQTTSPTQSTTPTQTQSGSAGSEMTVQGCLSGSSGSYTIADKNGTSYQLTGDTAKLSEHVGHEVRITGTSSSASASSSDANANATPGQSGSSQQTLQLTSVKLVAKTCQSGGMSH